MAKVELAKILDVDVDGIILPVKTELLLKLPPLLLVELVNSQQFVKGVKNAVCLGKMVYKVFSTISKIQKQSTCQFLSRQGQPVLPHEKDNILCKGQIPIELHHFAHALIHAGVTTVIVVGCGIKSRFNNFIELANHHSTPSSYTIPIRFDLGRHMLLSCILLFDISCDDYSGEIFPMLGDAGEGYGSVMLNIKESQTKNVYEKCIHILRII